MKIFPLVFILLMILCQCSPGEAGNSEASLLENVMEKHSNGKPKSIHYLDAKTFKIAKQALYYESGTLQTEGSFADGKRHGEWKAYYENGNTWSLNSYENGVLQGDYKTWFESGKPRIEGHYSGGKPSGIWKYFNEEGQVVREDNRDKPGQ